MTQKYPEEMRARGLRFVRHVGPRNRSENFPNFLQFEGEKFLLIGKYGISGPPRGYSLTMGVRPTYDQFDLPPSPSTGFSLEMAWSPNVRGYPSLALQAIAVVA